VSSKPAAAQGSYVTFQLSGYEIGEWKAPYHQDSLIYFSTDHLSIKENLEDPTLEEWEQKTYTLEISASALRERMDVLGFTLALAEEHFLTEVRSNWERLGTYDFMAAEITAPPDSIAHDLLMAAKATFSNSLPDREHWQELTELVIENCTVEKPDRAHLSSAMNYLDFSVIARLAVENFEGIATLDLTDIVQSEWLLEADLSNLNQSIDNQYLIITEGSTDKAIISSALKKFKPHLVDLFYFADEALPIPQTGASRVLELLKAFKSLKVINNVIAVFDNDAAGVEEYDIAVNVCEGAQNMEAIKLPDLDELTQIVCEGPDGRHVTNINGRAASIEMYLDRPPLGRGEVETKWTSHLKRSGAWQGEPLNKRKIQQHFHRHHADVSYNSVGIIAVLNEVISAASRIGERKTRNALETEEN
tara:strand:- start:2034 stop:3290 length:1257 start_codon:yes stop_codon:yes gene_type:complete